jgi:phosphoenolpyruvate carboxykinase (ATP)
MESSNNNWVGGRCIRPTPEELENFGTPDFTIYNAGQFPCNRYTHYMTSSTSIDLNLGRREMVILGTQYAGEMKKGLFSVMHYLMPQRRVLSLHSGCNVGKDGDVALFFGLSGMISSHPLHNLRTYIHSVVNDVLYVRLCLS